MDMAVSNLDVLNNITSLSFFFQLGYNLFIYLMTHSLHFINSCIGTKKNKHLRRKKKAQVDVQWGLILDQSSLHGCLQHWVASLSYEFEYSVK